MTRFAIDAAVARRLVQEDSDADRRHRLVGPSVLRTDVLAALYRDVRSGRLDPADGRRQLGRLAGLKLRLLGDQVSRATAWGIALDRGWDELGPAEYLAVALLQADVLVTEDAALREAAGGLVETADYGRLSDG